MTNPWDRTRVVKKFSPKQAGALKLARRFGNMLVCVRYRHDPEGVVRYTTVELVVDQMPVQKRKKLGTEREHDMVSVRVARDDREVLNRLISDGGHWDSAAHVWRLPRRMAKQLGLLGKLAPK